MTLSVLKMDFFKNRILNETVTVNWYLLAYPHTKKIITTKTMYIHKFVVVENIPWILF